MVIHLLNNEFYKDKIAYPHLVTLQFSNEAVNNLITQSKENVEMIQQVKIDGIQCVIFSTKWLQANHFVNSPESNLVYCSRNAMLSNTKLNYSMLQFCTDFLEKNLNLFFSKHPDIILYGEYDFKNVTMEKRKFFIFDVAQFLTIEEEDDDCPKLAVQFIDYRKFIPEFEELGLDYVKVYKVFKNTDEILPQLSKNDFHVDDMCDILSSSSPSLMNNLQIEGWAYKFFPSTDKDDYRDSKFIAARTKQLNPSHPLAVQLDIMRWRENQAAIVNQFFRF